MIEIQNIYKSYGNLQVLGGVSLSVGRGEIVAIVGPSGAGKTTLLQIAGSLDRPDSGTVSYDGTDITLLKERKLAEFRNRNIGFIFQFHELLPEFTALENVAMPGLIAGRKRREVLEEARELLTLLGLAERLDHRPSELSGGEKQRTAIARALINNPRIILADEPTGSLDSRNREEIHAIISRLCATRGHTFLIVTHDPTLASIAHRVVSMEDGRITSISRQTDSEEKFGESK
ncbi:ABC transporter ATP-binding protein [bacterium]|nr:ABC transporter ATP-binding protein [Bacteroidales bacterium]MBD5337929.1 ABC transporter ATP-binding protein [Bacteroides sp.]MBD5385122.1 ABC transporter ATP-binding protein [bacterium]MDE7509443.1 ABC transporter ATP-binding protein [Muribaculaceae bacterium]